LANLPGGGTIILGLDERAGFRPVSLTDPQVLKQGLAAKARAYTPPVSLSVGDGVVDGHPIVVAHVHECAPSAKPCRVTATGTAYLRGDDGDFPLSDLETQGFLAARRPPLFDRQPVDGASFDDLDPELVASYLATVRQDPPAVRARNQVTITGPIPRMLDTALNWARRTFDTNIVANPDGSVADQPAYPLVAFREIIANALIHRDLDDWSQAFAIEVRLRRDRLVVTNPGGRVIEALASGIPTIAHELSTHALPPAQYIDTNIRFTVLLRTPASRATPGPALNTTEQRIYDTLAASPKTVAEIETALGLTRPNIRKALRSLRNRGLVHQDGGKGRPTTYRHTTTRR